MKGNFVADELLKLKQLLDSNTITEDEFETQKKKLLAVDANDTLESPSGQPQKAMPLSPKKRKKGCGCLVGLILFGVVSVVVIQQAITPGTSFYDDIHPESENLTPEDWLAFDDKTWADFATLYHNHNAMLSWVDGYTQGTVDAATLYSKCEEFKELFRSLSLSYDYGVNDEQNTYLSVFESVALSDQMAMQSMLKYLNSKKTSDLNNVSTNIQNAKKSIAMIASNRGVLLTKAKLTPEEIQKRVNDSMTTLE